MFIECPSLTPGFQGTPADDVAVPAPAEQHARLKSLAAMLGCHLADLRFGDISEMSAKRFICFSPGTVPGIETDLQMRAAARVAGEGQATAGRSITGR
jgi:hypothetical protein